MNTPTPRTDKAWSCFSGYTQPLQDVKDLSHELERELTAMTEQRDGLRDGIDYASNQLTKVKEQRDRLAEALRKAISWGDAASHHVLHRQNINWTYLNEAKEALQSLNKPTEL